MNLEQNPSSILILILFTIIFSIQFCVTISQDSSTIYEILMSNGLPKGLFPKGVTNFTFDKDSCKFQVFLDQACNAKIEVDFHYDSNISGILTFGQISQLSGISVKDLFLWFQVKSIWVDIPSSGLIYFDVGVVSKQFSLSSFDTPRECLTSSVPKILSRKLGHKEPNHLKLLRADL